MENHDAGLESNEDSNAENDAQNAPDETAESVIKRRDFLRVIAVAGGALWLPPAVQAAQNAESRGESARYRDAGRESESRRENDAAANQRSR